ncbi:hypothetical protein [Halomarina rubra]|uniref:Uncharacterized protein n=1 Tax=Halomarina rubra TaxID=2071873 RepID=A0ABD6AUT5_9EURY|nr:hypothetical protein [Halomarina rubra]
MRWTRADWLSRSLLLLGMWSFAVGTAGLALPRGLVGMGVPLDVATGLSAVAVGFGGLALVAGFVVFGRYVDTGELALSAEAVAERWNQQ